MCAGEPQFLERMQLKYDQAAQEGGVHVVGACGYDSVPAELGLVHLASHFPGTVVCCDVLAECGAVLILAIVTATGNPTHTYNVS